MTVVVLSGDSFVPSWPASSSQWKGSDWEGVEEGDVDRLSGSEQGLFIFPLFESSPVCTDKVFGYVEGGLGGVVRLTVPIPSHPILEAGA